MGLQIVYVYVCMYVCVYKISNGKCFELSFLCRKTAIQHVVFVNFTI